MFVLLKAVHIVAVVSLKRYYQEVLLFSEKKLIFFGVPVQVKSKKTFPGNFDESISGIFHVLKQFLFTRK